MRCTQCGLDESRYQKLEKVARAAKELITEGRVEDNQEGVVDASTNLIDAIVELDGAETGGLGALQ